MKLTIFPVFLFFLIASCADKKEHTKAVISNITVSLYASASVKAKDQYIVLSSVPGIVAKVNVQPGNLVKQGDVLFILEHKEAMLNAESARESLYFVRGNNQKKSGLVQQALLLELAAREKYQLDSSFFYRQENLWRQDIGTRAEFAQRRLAFQTSRMNYASAVESFEQLKRQLNNELRVSQINYDISRKRQTDYLIKSKIDGKVYDVSIKNQGELISTQTPLAVMGNQASFYLEMNVDEHDITQVKPGQRVEITMDSYKGRSFKGEVSEIYPIMDQRSRTFKVEALLVNPPEKLFPNLTAEANIIVKVKKNVMLIPRNYLDKNSCVWLSDRIKKKVVTGVQDEKNIEILRGLDTLQTIYKPE